MTKRLARRVARWLYVSALMLDPRLAHDSERDWYEAVREVVSSDLRDDRVDEIVLRGDDLAAEWSAVRALITEYEHRETNP